MSASQGAVTVTWSAGGLCPSPVLLASSTWHPSNLHEYTVTRQHPGRCCHNNASAALGQTHTRQHFTQTHNLLLPGLSTADPHPSCVLQQMAGLPPEHQARNQKLRLRLPPSPGLNSARPPAEVLLLSARSRTARRRRGPPARLPQLVVAGREAAAAAAGETWQCPSSRRY